MFLSRRDVLRVGTVAVMGTACLRLSAASERRPARAKAVILLFMDGGPSHIDLSDLKPDAAAEIRGPFRSIPTSAPGVRICEHLPKLASRMHHLPQLRSVRHADAIHDPAVYFTLTDKRHPTPLGGLKVALDDAPNAGALFAATRTAITSRCWQVRCCRAPTRRSPPSWTISMLGVYSGRRWSSGWANLAARR